MFGALTDKFQNLFRTLAGQKKLSEKNISDAIREVRLALLDADVNFKVVSSLIKKIKEKAIGVELIKSVKAQDQFIKIVHEELIELMMHDEVPINFKANPTVIMLCGLQGSGKTTHAAKLAKYLKRDEFSKSPLLVACDLQRPAAIEQLKSLGAQIDVPVFSLPGETDPIRVVKEAMKVPHHDVIILDTAGRLHVDEELMEQLGAIQAFAKPHEVLFVANASIGQEAAKIAKEFSLKVPITGTILTMLDGTSRAGAAISIREMTGKPLKFEGIGEKVGDLQVFNSKSMADRILGMGDMVNLVKRAEEHIDEAESQAMEQKIRKATFNFEDYMNQMKMIKKMGPLKGLMKMMPGFSQMPEMDASEAEFGKVETIILSMTVAERRGDCEMVPSRRRRMASGSGTTVDDVNRLIKGFKQIKKLMKGMKSNKFLSRLNS